MALVVTHLEVFKLVVEDRFGAAINVQRGRGEGRSRQLQLHLLVVVAVNVAVAAGPNEVAYLEIALLRHHVGEQRVACDIERHASKDVCAALVELATQLALATRRGGWRHIELEERMARHQRHFGQVGHIPSADDDAAGIGVGF